MESERGSSTVYEIYIGFCPRLELDEILHNGCLGYNTDDYETLAFKCSSIVNLWCFVRGHYQIRECLNINLRTVNRISFFRCWNVFLIKAIISTCFDTMDGFMYLAIVWEQ